MAKGIIRLAYRKVIDTTSTAAWEKCVFNDSYNEYLMQSQLYNKNRQYKTFGELVQHVPAAEKLHFLVSASVTGYVKQFNGMIPAVTNAQGKPYLPFKGYRFEILNTDITNAAKHSVAISFITEPLTWIDTIGNQLLISVSIQGQEDAELLTELVALQPSLSIHSYKQIPQLWYHNQMEKYS